MSVSREVVRAVAKVGVEQLGYKKGPVKSRDGYAFGLESGLRVIALWNSVMHANFELKLTDAEIAELMAREFPNREKMQPVTRERSYFNNGRFGMGTKGVVRQGDQRLPQYVIDSEGDRVPV